jgi:hypothetical protein
MDFLKCDRGEDTIRAFKQPVAQFRQGADLIEMPIYPPPANTQGRQRGFTKPVGTFSIRDRRAVIARECRPNSRHRRHQPLRIHCTRRFIHALLKCFGTRRKFGRFARARQQVPLPPLSRDNNKSLITTIAASSELTTSICY